MLNKYLMNKKGRKSDRMEEVAGETEYTHMTSLQEKDLKPDFSVLFKIKKFFKEGSRGRI